MNLPGFTAASSLRLTEGIYRGQSLHGKSSVAVTAQQVSGVENTIGNCFGGNCIADFCSDLVGAEEAKCKAACAKPAKCGGCRCTVSGGIRRCLRSCTKSTPSAFLRCTGPCFGDQVFQQ